VVTVLILAGADIHARGAYEYTPLHAAVVKTMNVETIKALVDAGADVNAKAQNGYTPLHIAAGMNENPEVILSLLELGADPRIIDGDGKTAWDYIRENESLKDTEAYKALQK
jgi:ankyrin repeat protein